MLGNCPGAPQQKGPHAPGPCMPTNALPPPGTMAPLALPCPTALEGVAKKTVQVCVNLLTINDAKRNVSKCTDPYMFAQGTRRKRRKEQTNV
ncbi:hypothetical protein FKM82_013440 [Ascaphus truei]